MKKYIVITLMLALLVLSACTAKQILTNPQTPNDQTQQQQETTQQETTQQETTQQQTTQQETTQQQALNQQQTPAEQTPSQQQQTSAEQQQTISRERAIELALKAAGVDKASAFDIEAELDNERGIKVWEVDFETSGHEYSYDINATDGTITKAERESND